MSTLFWFLLSAINSIGLEVDYCGDRTVVVGDRCRSSSSKTSGPTEEPIFQFEEPLEISNGF